MCFDSRNREEPANPNVEAIFNREVEVEILQNRIEAVLFVGLQELLAEVALRGREAIVDTVESRHMVSPVEMAGLHCVGEAFDAYDRLIEFDLVGKNVVGDREGILGRGAEIEAAREPSVDYCAAVLEIERRHQGISIAIGCADVGCASVSPVGEWERRRIHGWSSWVGACPALAVELR